MNFTKGWMCPIYKKKDRTQIENYRPIILLNSDYKTFTKALSLQLIEPMKAMIHHNQAGFIPGQSTSDQIRGFHFPGVKEKLAINLFADNTIIYINKDDKDSDLKIILN